MSVTAGNSGGLDLVLSNASLSGADPLDFSLNASLPLTIHSLNSSSFPVQFSPRGTGARTAYLSFYNNDNAASPFTIALAGNGVINPPSLAVPQILTNGQVQFSFTNSPYASFTVLTATNLAVPSSNWTVAGAASNAGGNNFLFTIPAPTNSARQFYQLRSP